MTIHSSTGRIDLAERSGPKSLRSPELEIAEYADDMADLDISEAQKTEFLETLWAVLVQIAHMGFHYDVCGQMLEEFNQVTDEGASALKSDRSTNKEKPSD